MYKNIFRKSISLLLICMYTMLQALTLMTVEAKADNSLDLQSPSYILMEAATGTVICEKNSTQALHPASVTKIMTLLLIFDALESGRINMTDEVTVSEYAASMGGSQVFLEPLEVQTVETLIKCISVASANDASVAMAEYICGSEAEFVARMNERAKGLGMDNTHFDNCCGLDTDTHKMSARDVALMSRELITRYPKVHEFSTIWMDTITHTTRRGSTEFGLSNTNKLIKQYTYATGLKTGSTSKAKCCLSATANKDGVELIAVIMAAPNSKTRFSDAISLLNYGYGICRMYIDEESNIVPSVNVDGGIKSKLKCGLKQQFKHLFIENYDSSQISKKVKLKMVKAPVKKDQIIGECVYYYADKEIGSVEITALEDIKKAGFKDYVLKTFRMY